MVVVVQEGVCHYFSLECSIVTHFGSSKLSKHQLVAGEADENIHVHVAMFMVELQPRIVKVVC